MGYKDDMERCTEYIASHLTEELEPVVLARQFGYSFYHFCRVFRSINGISVGKYIQQLRLDRAACDLADGKSVTRAAMDWGFETPSGFYKAFSRQFGMAPSAYKKQKGMVKGMEATIKKVEGFRAVGYVFRPEKEVDVLENGAYWYGKDFSSVSREEYEKLTYPGYAEIGAWIRPDDTGEMRYFLGPTVKKISHIPSGMEELSIDGGEYAVFQVESGADTQALRDNIKKMWHYIFSEWFDGSGYRYDEGRQDYEYYQGEGTFIYIPVLKA